MLWLGSFWSRPPEKPTMVSITRWDPPWFRGPTLRDLAPVSSDGAKIETHNRREWIEAYKAVLSESGRIESLRRLLDRLIRRHDSLLLACWCKAGRNRRDGSYSGNFCHRLLAGRLLHRLGYPVTVVDLECPKCQGDLSFNGGLSDDDVFVCKTCRI